VRLSFDHGDGASSVDALAVLLLALVQDCLGCHLRSGPSRGKLSPSALPPAGGPEHFAVPARLPAPSPALRQPAVAFSRNKEPPDVAAEASLCLVARLLAMTRSGTQPQQPRSQDQLAASVRRPRGGRVRSGREALQPERHAWALDRLALILLGSASSLDESEHDRRLRLRNYCAS